MQHGQETASGVAWTATFATVVDWAMDPTVRGTLCVIAAFGAASWSYYIARKAENDAARRDKNIQDRLADMVVNDVEVAAMIARILHKDDVKKEYSSPAATVVTITTGEAKP